MRSARSSTSTTGPATDRVDITRFPSEIPRGASALTARPSGRPTRTHTPGPSIAPTITQEPLDDPNLLLGQHIAGLALLSTDVIQISTPSNAVPGGGTDNIEFLVGNAGGPNADAVQMSATV
jgi:hypothetical protein